jgi:peptide-methionine (S)-S-oxide reductase
LLQVFFLAHDPTTLNKQGNDIGTQYRSIIFYSNNNEKEKALSYIGQLEDQNIYNPIVTELQPLIKFYVAEQYHQDYFKLNSIQPYCAIVIKPKIQKLKKELKKYYK